MKHFGNKKNELSRRDFLKSSSVCIGAAAIAGLNAVPANGESNKENIVKWDKEIDVLVVGTGFAGIASAITAHDAGAKVLILEKAPKELEGGNSKVSGNMWWTPTDVETGIKYITALCYGLTDQESIKALAQGLFENNEWLKKLGVEPGPFGIFQPEYPELPGSEAVRTWSNTKGGFGAGATLYNPLRAHLDNRNIPIMYQTRAMELIRNNNGEIIGIKAESEGKTLSIKATKGVILACGGFEFAHDIQQQFLPGWPMYGRGSTYNTGDGIRMAQQAGADLWHMNNALAGIGAIIVDDDDLGKKIPVSVSMFGSPYILTDQQGRRFMNESIRGRHGLGEKEHLIYFDTLNTQTFTRIPCYAICDSRILKRPLVSTGMKMGWYTCHSKYKWSQDNSAEIEKGWIIKAESIRELADKLGIKTGLLEKTITTYNQFCDAGIDSEFARPKENLTKIDQPPYVALKIYPIMYNTQGGPRRNASCQIVDPFNNPIPRLYSAGELGSFWGWMYNGGGNNSECLATGRIAGANAAALKPW
jgi:succinate dehydrogenase/fumarate reductase flavoprotein subunit